MSWRDLPEPDPTSCAMCGRDANYSTLCEECREYLNVFEVRPSGAELDAARVTAEWKTPSQRRADSGRVPIDESPLFGGPKQGSLFKANGYED